MARKNELETAKDELHEALAKCESIDDVEVKNAHARVFKAKVEAEMKAGSHG